MEAAELLGAGIAKALLGKAAVPDDIPYVTGSIGLLGTKPSYDMMMNCDTLLMVGSSFPYSEFLPEEGQARGVQIDINGRMVSIRYPMVEAGASGKTGIGYSYADTATAKLINDKLADIVVGRDALSIGYCWEAMIAEIRNLGRPGICSMAIAAVNNALWD
jgi:hypothetical protein